MGEAKRRGDRATRIAWAELAIAEKIRVKAEARIEALLAESERIRNLSPEELERHLEREKLLAEKRRRTNELLTSVLAAATAAIQR